MNSKYHCSKNFTLKNFYTTDACF